MSTKTIRTQIQLRYDTEANWLSKNPVLGLGEVAFVVKSTNSEGDTLDTPVILTKAGNGTDTFSALPYTAAIAGDVYPWAKAATKPTYAATEITGLEDFIASEIEDTNTKYQLVASEDDDKTYILQSQEIGETTWTNVSTITVPEDITYTVETTEDGKVQFVPSEGEAITIVQIESDPTAIATGSAKVPTAGAVADYVEDKIDTLETDIKQSIVGVYRYVGVVDTKADLPTSGNTVGDTYHVKADKGEYAWTESTDEDGETIYYWEDFGKLIDMSEMEAEIAKKQDKITEDNKLSVALVDGLASTSADGLMSKEDKTKLDGIAEEADVNVIEKVTAGGTEVAITDKTVALAKIAQTGNLLDLIQDTDNVLILDCGDAEGYATTEVAD